MENKRKAEEEGFVEDVEESESTTVTPSKRPRSDGIVVSNSNAGKPTATNESLPSNYKRTSSLSSPIMLLTGHKAEVNAVRFSPTGDCLASAGGDREILFWNLRGAEITSYLVLKGHQNSILELNWNIGGTHIATASADKTMAIWDVEHGVRMKKCKEHKSFVNGVALSRRGQMLAATVSDDASMKLWDPRAKRSVHTFSHTFPLTCVAFGDIGNTVFTGGIDNVVRSWDFRTCQVTHSFTGHEDVVTGIRISHDGSYLLSTAMDDTVRIWDVRPYAPTDRMVKVFTGSRHSADKGLLRCAWSPDGERVSAASGDQCVYIWDTSTRSLLYKLPGHAGTVMDVDFHPREPIIASCSTDRTIYLGEINTTTI